MSQTNSSFSANNYAQTQTGVAEALAYGRKVARDLELSSVAEDTYVVRTARYRTPVSGYGFVDLVFDETLPRAERTAGIGGWRVHSRVMDELVKVHEFEEVTEHILSRDVEEIWLLRNGDLQLAKLHTDEDGYTSVQSAPLDENTIATLGDHEQVREERLKLGKIHRTLVLTSQNQDGSCVLEDALTALRQRIEQ